MNKFFIFLKTIIFIFYFEACSCVFAGNEPEIKCEYIVHARAMAERVGDVGSPVIDGKFTEAVWAKLSKYGNFIASNGFGRVEDGTEFKVCFDNRNLYLGIKVYDSSVGTLRKVIRKRDGRVWLDDCIEILIDSNCDRKSFYHIIVNSIATLYDEYVEENDKSNAKWNCSIKAATKINKDSWQVELAIPLGEIGITDVDKISKMGFNICREQRSRDGLILSQWVPSLDVRGAFLRSESFGVLYFSKSQMYFNVNAVRLGWEENNVVLEGKIVGNAKAGNVRGEYCSEGYKRLWKAIGSQIVFDNKGKFKISLPNVAEESCFVRLKLSGADEQCPNDFLILKIGLPRKIHIKLVSPYYKDCIFEGQEIKTIEAIVKSDFAGKIDVLLSDEGGNVIYEKRFEDAKIANRISIPCEKLAAGKYVLESKLIQDKSVVSKLQRIIRKLKAKKGAFWISKNRILMKDGKPIMPIGYMGLNYYRYYNAPSLKELAGQSVNAGHTYFYRRGNDKSLSALLDEAAQAGVMIAIYPFYDLTLKQHGQARLSKSARKEIIEKVNKYKNHPGLLGWYLADEPEIHNKPVSFYEDMYKLISELDPYHPCIMLNDTLLGVKDYAVACDITMPDPYVIPRKRGALLKPMSYISGFMEAGHSTGKVVWIAPQAFDYAAYTIAHADTRAPSYREERCMAYLAIIHGARGFLYFALPYILPDADLRIGMPYITKEIGVVSKTLIDEGEICKLKTSSSNIEGIVKRCGNKLLIIAVNNAAKATIAEMNIPKRMINNMKRLNVLAENRTIDIANGILRDEFGKYDTHIYYVNIPETNNLKTVGAVEKEIAEYKRKIAEENKDNLAFAGNGARLKASKYKFSIWLNNGIVNEPNWQDAASEDKPAWVEIKLPKKQKVSRVVINATSFNNWSIRLKHICVFANQNDEWKKVAEFSKDNNKEKIIEIKFEPIVTDKIRIEIYKPKRICIAEIQVYG